MGTQLKLKPVKHKHGINNILGQCKLDPWYRKVIDVGRISRTRNFGMKFSVKKLRLIGEDILDVANIVSGELNKLKVWFVVNKQPINK